MTDHSPSRIYVTDTGNRSYYVSVISGSGKDFKGHSGGIAISGKNAYIASGDKIYAIPLSSLLDTENGDRVKISKIIPVNNEASFIYADENNIYVGEYHDGKTIFTDHPYETPDGKIVLSTSLDICDTIYYVYSEADAIYSGNTLDGVPVYYLYDHVQQIKVPAMGEDVDYFDGRIITLTESASNKYIFGKFFNANKIVALNLG